MGFEPIKILINGEELSSDDDRQVSIYSPSFQYGLSILEGLRGYSHEGKIKLWELEPHIKRLIRSSKLIGFDLPVNIEKEIENDVYKLTKNIPAEDIYLKFLLSYIQEGSWNTTRTPDRVAFIYPLKSNLRTSNNFPSAKGEFTSYERINANSLSPYIKCGANYINSRLAFLEVNFNREETIYPIFLTKNGLISESSGSAVFIIKKNKLITPPIKNDILPSITRNFLIEKICPQINLQVVEKDINRWELLDSEGVFLVGTNVEILNISNIGRHEICTNNEVLKLLYEKTRNEVINDL